MGEKPFVAFGPNDLLGYDLMAGKNSPYYKPSMAEFMAQPLNKRFLAPSGALLRGEGYLLFWDAEKHEALLGFTPKHGLSLVVLRTLLKAWHERSSRKTITSEALVPFLSGIAKIPEQSKRHFGLCRFKHLGKPVGLGLTPAVWKVCHIALVELFKRQYDEETLEKINVSPIGLVWRPEIEPVAQYLSAIKLLKAQNHAVAKQNSNAATGVTLGMVSSEGDFSILGMLVDEEAFFRDILENVMQGLTLMGVDLDDLEGSFERLTGQKGDPDSWELVALLPKVEALAAAEGARAAPAEPTAPEEPPVAGARVAKPVLPETVVTPWWQGDADTLFEEVLTGRLPLTFSLEGVPLVVDGLPSATEAGPRNGKRRSKGEPKPLADTLPDVARSQFAVLPEAVYLLLDARRSAAKRYLEHLLGEPLPYHRRDTVNLLPDQLWAVPAVVSGQYGHWRDRLGRVRVLNPNLLTGLVPREPLSFRVTRDGKVVTLTFADNTPAQLAVCPSGWLRDTTPWWLAGLFGTPLDPTLLDFCPTLPAAWWERLAEVLAKVPDTAGTTPLDLDALLRNRPTAEI